MRKHALGFGLLAGCVACAAPQRGIAPDDLRVLRGEIAHLRQSVADLENSVGHLQSEVSAASADNELTAMTIDSVAWSENVSGSFVMADEPVLLCHVVEWRDFGKMLRFTRKSDPSFVLEADGHPPVSAHMATGGVCNSDGSTRFVMLEVSGPLAQDAPYRLRPRNDNESYRWFVPNNLVVASGPSKR
jgi:hypothetical protein